MLSILLVIIYIYIQTARPSCTTRWARSRSPNYTCIHNILDSIDYRKAVPGYGHKNIIIANDLIVQVLEVLELAY